MDVAQELRNARVRAGLSQVELAHRAATSQATLSAYESGRKRPSVATLERLLAAAGARLSVVADRTPVSTASARRLEATARALSEVLALAEALPTRHEPELRFPRLPVAAASR